MANCLCMAAQVAKALQQQYERREWVKVFVRHNKSTTAAKRAADQVLPGNLPVASCTSVRQSLERCTPATDAALVHLPAPTIPPGSNAMGRISYTDLQSIAHGGFGEVLKGMADNQDGSKTPYALKRALPEAKGAADIDQHLDQQRYRLDSLRREAHIKYNKFHVYDFQF